MVSGIGVFVRQTPQSRRFHKTAEDFTTFSKDEIFSGTRMDTGFEPCGKFEDFISATRREDGTYPQDQAEDPQDQAEDWGDI
jgi:hypothetical protein